MAARLSYAFGFGQRSAEGPGGGPDVVIQRVGGTASAGDLLGGVMGGGAENKRIRFELFASAQNLLNSVNPIGYSGVMTSPFFGQPTAAMPARRIDVGMQDGVLRVGRQRPTPNAQFPRRGRSNNEVKDARSSQIGGLSPRPFDAILLGSWKLGVGS